MNWCRTKGDGSPCNCKKTIASTNAIQTFSCKKSSGTQDERNNLLTLAGFNSPGK
ncbi:MAG: hypothetical protein Q2306_02120 [Phytoplasma sp.]|uniref:hypothetical protein n=1 Tax=Phytoplasma sp. TaxID=2155 RepID=UPI002B414282|nr:hypothetical protein [Phytoplasma sp.]WRH06670.1 MAG: hypothetical protein Q2306_02120 [Phytoplasma sp.]